MNRDLGGLPFRLLIDSCVSGVTVAELRTAGYDAVWVPADGADPGDVTVLTRALEDARILVTLDKDFGELVHARGLPHAGILRLHGFAAREQAAQIGLTLKRFGAELQAGAMVVATPGRWRLRNPPL